ncbi:MAG: Excinuclease ABC C subunit domain protein [Microgenomates group bacterium GW2011_GWA2_46_16]|nr:MAG: Excinuclease ABC C subunit domain protein [Microgenomates group bacterium GW2011_GWA2_46_16]
MDHRRTTILKKSTQKITTRPGVYLYSDKNGKIIYVGKAKNLRNRVRQYFVGSNAVGEKTSLLVSQIVSIKTIPTDCELDALLLEATLIRKHLPKYNAIARDDKSPLYIVITFDEPLPRILFMRKKELEHHARRAVFGPFQSAVVARRLMQSVRKIIPYCTQKRRDGRPCFYTQIGLCNPCPSAITTKSLASAYRSSCKKISLLLSGRTRQLRNILERKMQECARRMAYEKAGEIKKQLDVLNMLLTHNFDPAMFVDTSSDRLSDLSARLGLPLLHRIECIDISTLAGNWSTGSLVVFTDGQPDTDQYRRFRIKTAGKPNDTAMMAEVIKRRFTHAQWPKPDLLVVDGGKGQVTAAKHAPVPVVGLAKRFEEIIVPENHGFRVIRLSPASAALQLVQHIRDEAHRFAKQYHTMLRSIHT